MHMYTALVALVNFLNWYAFSHLIAKILGDNSYQWAVWNCYVMPTQQRNIQTRYWFCVSGF